MENIVMNVKLNKSQDVLLSNTFHRWNCHFQKATNKALLFNISKIKCKIKQYLIIKTLSIIV